MTTPSVLSLHPIVAALHPIVAALHPSVAALHPIVAALHPIVAALHPIVAALHPIVAALHPIVAALHPIVFRAASPFDTIFGLPVHALVVHAVVVLLPLTALLAIAMAARADWSRRLGAATFAGAVLCTGAAYVAGKSGEQLQSRIDTPFAKSIHAAIATHASVGRQVKYVALGLLIMVALLWWTDRRSRDGGRRVAVAWVIAVVTAATAAATITWTVRAGDSGARAVWRGTVQNTKPGTYPTTTH